MRNALYMHSTTFWVVTASQTMYLQGLTILQERPFVQRCACSLTTAVRDMDPDWRRGTSPHLQVKGAQIGQGTQRINAVRFYLPHFQTQVSQFGQRAQLQHSHKTPSSVAHPQRHPLIWCPLPSSLTVALLLCWQGQKTMGQALSSQSS